MKKTFYPFLLAFLVVACQQQKPTAQATAATVEVTAPSFPAVPAAEPELPSLFTAADTLTQPARELLRHTDLSRLWEGSEGIRRTNPTMEGFFGPDHYRFAMVFNEVKRDQQHPEMYMVRGKCHYRKNVRPFAGTLTIRQLVDLDYPYFLQVMAMNDSTAADSVDGRMYTARAQLRFQEDKQTNSGVFEGEALLDFYVAPPAKMGYVTSLADGINESTPTRGSGVLVRGSRRNLSTREVKGFVVAPWAIAAAADVYKDFGIGDRGGEINPKYAKLGWNELWENDEWWADSPKPKLSL
ncbi:hypothetical protein [Hymenobacter ruber]